MTTARPLTDAELLSLERKGNKTSAERRLLATVKLMKDENANLSARLDSVATPTPAIEETEVAEQAYASREKVLVVIHGDGYVQAYAERWIDVKFVELWPWEDEDEVDIPETYRAIHFPSKVRMSGMPRLTRQASFAETCLRFVEWRERAERNGALYAKLDDLIDGLRTK